MVQPSQTAPADQPEPPRLKFLRWLVVTLTVTMILGLITIIVLIVMTFMRAGETSVPMTSEITLPEGHTALAFTQGTNWIAVTAKDGDGLEYIHILAPDTGAIRQTIEIKPAP